MCSCLYPTWPGNQARGLPGRVVDRMLKKHSCYSQLSTTHTDPHTPTYTIQHFCTHTHTHAPHAPSHFTPTLTHMHHTHPHIWTPSSQHVSGRPPCFLCESRWLCAWHPDGHGGNQPQETGESLHRTLVVSWVSSASLSHTSVNLQELAVALRWQLLIVLGL